MLDLRDATRAAMSRPEPGSSRSEWPARAVTEPNLMVALQDRLSVALIATPRSELRTCHVTESIAAAMARNDKGFDYFPVTDNVRPGRERIIGLVELIPYVHGKPHLGNVRDQMRRLSEDNMIGADADILGFLRTADRDGCRLVIAGAEVSGLVCLA